eukprot:TRINITY_DN11227_c0_g1_i3.p1 TRINITY_DN11227_c0_g1~~TRINITY_DN11227_c0_g1_i3.p1  ORF type:complete len:896 (-),score=128.58 TRINITY_DN11227_c0_g1_i3:75-2762(-)
MATTIPGRQSSAYPGLSAQVEDILAGTKTRSYPSSGSADVKPSPASGSSLATQIEDVASRFELGFCCFPLRTTSKASRGHTSLGDDVSRLLGHFQSLRRLRHPRLCRYLDLLIGRDHLALVVSEHFSESLATLLHRRPSGLGLVWAGKILKGSAEALCYLNSQALIHGHLGADVVVVSEDGFVKVTGHGLTHLVAAGGCAEMVLRPRSEYAAPEVATPDVSSTAVASCAGTFARSPSAGGPKRGRACEYSCKVDVWSLGVIVLETLGGAWDPQVPKPVGEAGKSVNTEGLGALVQIETARALHDFANALDAAAVASNATAVDNTVVCMLTAVDALTGRTNCLEDSLAEPVVLRKAFQEGSEALADLEDSYRKWLAGGQAWKNFPEQPAQMLQTLWTSCLTLKAAGRPTPADLLSHPALASILQDRDRESASGLRWSSALALRSERLRVLSPEDIAKSLDPSFEGSASSSSALQYLQTMGVEVEDVFYWWKLAGGDAFAELAAAGHLRPVPPVFRLPLISRDDGGSDDERGEQVPFLQALPNSEAFDTTLLSACSISARGLWGPAPVLQPRIVGIMLKELCAAIANVDRQGGNDSTSFKPASLYMRQDHFAYQWHRVKMFNRILLGLPKSTKDLVREAAEDIPPLLRPRIWAAVLGADADSDRACWSVFYEQLLAGPVDFTGEEQRLAAQCSVCHELISHHKGRLRLERVVYGILKANSLLTRMEGLGALAAPLCMLYADNETAAFMLMQRMLHGSLWHFFSEESPMKRRQCAHLFSALLRFADPLLELHLQTMGLLPEQYASTWFPTWFAQLLPLPQLLLLWDMMLLRPPQFSLFVAVCIVHFFRRALCGLEEVSQASNFLVSCAPLIDVAVLRQASLAFFQSVPASMTLPLYSA